MASNLICADKIEGTSLFDRHGEKLGTVRDLMIDKSSGKVRHFIVGFGGLFGMGEEHYPMPWDSLTYEPDKDGYVARFDRSKIDKDKAPRFAKDKQPEWNADYDRTVTLYYLPL